MPFVRRANLILILLLSLLLAGLGHYTLLYRRAHAWDVVLFYAAAALLMAWVAWRMALVWKLNHARTRAALDQLGSALGELFQRPTWLLVVMLVALNGAGAGLAFLARPLISLPIVVLVALLWACSVLMLASLALWPGETTIARPVPRHADRSWVRTARAWVVTREPKLSRVLLILGLVCALLGQTCFFYQRELVRLGVLCWFVAVLALGVLTIVRRLAAMDSPVIDEPAPSPSVLQRDEVDGGAELEAEDTSPSLPLVLPLCETSEPGVEEDRDAARGRRPDGRRSGWLPPWGMLVSLPIALLSQCILTCFPSARWIGIVGYAVALSFLVGSLGKRSRRLTILEWAARLSWRFSFLAAAAILVAWAAYVAHSGQPEEGGVRQALVLWGLGLALGVVGLAGPAIRGLVWRRGWWREASVVGLLFVVALLLRTVGLAQFPDVMSGDEGSMALEAGRILDGSPVNPFGTGWLGHHNLFFYMEATALRLLGHSLFGLRFTAALLGALGVAAVYLLARWSFGREVAWIAAAFATGWGLPLHFSRLALNNSADLLVGALVLALLQRGLLRGSRLAFVASGLALGLGLYFYYGTRLLIPIVLVVLFVAGARRLRRHWRGLVAFAFVALLACGPLIVHLIQHPDYLFPRGAEIGLFRSGQLAYEQQLTGEPVWLLALAHLGRATFAFIYTPDEGYFYRPSTPMLTVFSGALFVLGVGLALRRWREERYAVLLAWIGLTVVFGGFLLTSPPHYQRYLIAAPAVCLLVGKSAAAMLRLAARMGHWRPRLRRAGAVLVAVALLAIDAGYYFGVYAPRGAFIWDRNTLIADRTARLMAELGPQDVTYFFGTDYMPLRAFNSVPFLAPQAEWMDVLDHPGEEWGFVDESRGAFFVVIPEREGDLEALRERFPGGEEAVVRARSGSVLFTTYYVAPPVAAGE